MVYGCGRCAITLPKAGHAFHDHLATPNFVSQRVQTAVQPLRTSKVTCHIATYHDFYGWRRLEAEVWIKTCDGMYPIKRRVSTL